MGELRGGSAGRGIGWVHFGRGNRNAEQAEAEGCKANQR